MRCRGTAGCGCPACVQCVVCGEDVREEWRTGPVHQRCDGAVGRRRDELRARDETSVEREDALAALNLSGQMVSSEVSRVLRAFRDEVTYLRDALRRQREMRNAEPRRCMCGALIVGEKCDVCGAR